MNKCQYKAPTFCQSKSKPWLLFEPQRVLSGKMFEATEKSKRPKLSLSSSCKHTPPETMIEEKQDLMISPTGGDPFHKTAHFLKPISPSSIPQPFLNLPHSTSSSSLPKWNLKVDFPGWQHGPKKWKAWVEALAPLHQSTWKKAGIFEAIFSSTYQIKRDNDLMFGLAEKWCCETNTFVFAWGEATITLEDVMVLGGFSVLGDSIFSPLESRELREVQNKLEKERKEIIRSSVQKAKTGTWFNKYFNSGSEFEHEAFLAYWLSRYVYKSEIVYKHVISIAIQLARGTKISLAPAVLASIYNDLSKLRSSDDINAVELNLRSPLHFVQVWAWERVLELSPLANLVSNVKPRLARWDKVDGLSVEDLRRVLDSAGEGFMWRPYSLAIDNWKCPGYYLEKDKWVGPGLDDEFLSFAICLRVTELNGFGPKEGYFPHRVARQFGYDQDIPCVVAQSDAGSDIFSGKENPHIAWNDHIKETKKLTLYIPSRLSEADVSTRYMKWWEETVFKHISEPRMPQEKKAKTTEGPVLADKRALMPPGFQRTEVAYSSIERNKFTGFTIPSVSCSMSSKKAVEILKVQSEGNDSLVPPGFPPSGNVMEAGDEPTNPEILGGGKHKNVKSRKRVDESIADESFVDILMSERLEEKVVLSPTLIWGCKAKRSIKYVIMSNARSPDNDMVTTICNEWASRVERQVSELKTIVRCFKESDFSKDCKKHENIETRRGGDCVKLSGEVQNLASSTVEEDSVISMKSERFEEEAILSEALIVGSKAKTSLNGEIGCKARSPDNHMVSNLGNACASCSSLYEKQVSELKDRVSRLESLTDMFQANTRDDS